MGELIFILTMGLIIVGFPIVGMIIADQTTKAHCEQWVKEMELLRDNDYRKALRKLNHEFPGVKEG